MKLKLRTKELMKSLNEPLTGSFNSVLIVCLGFTLLDLEEDRCKTYGHPATVIEDRFK